MKHPRAADLTRHIRAVEAAGKTVTAVRVHWEEVDGRDVPVWEIRTTLEPERSKPQAIDWT